MNFIIDSFDIIFDEDKHQVVKFDLKSPDGEIISYKDMFLDYYDENYGMNLEHFPFKMKLIFEEFIHFLKIG